MGQLPCLAISSSVTSFGREMINRTAEYITNVYLTFTSKKYEGAKVIYGDTDSVMVKFKGIETVEEAMKIVKFCIVNRVEKQQKMSHQSFLLQFNWSLKKFTILIC